MHWERPQIKVFNSQCIDPDEKLQDLDIPIRGIDIAVSNCNSFPAGVIDEELRGVLLNCRGQFSQKLDQQAKCFAPLDATTPEMEREFLSKNLSITYKDLPASFFLYCVLLLLEDSSTAKKTDHMVLKAVKTGESQWSFRRITEVVKNLIPSNHNLTFAFKSSLSLGLAVLFGLIYNKENGYWSGLTIAISFVTGRQPTFSVANARGQGTAMGSIYGILCCFIFQRFEDLRFLPLIPWVVFSYFLRHSRMYGQAGGISADIGALLILGRRNYGPPSQFTVARIAEATIGLICFIIVEILLSPSRAATLAKSELSQSLTTLRDCIGQIRTITPNKREMSSSSYEALIDKQKKLKSIVCQLEEFIAEAELEPNFWFLPFHRDCYHKILESLSRMADLLLFAAYSMENVTRLSQKEGVFWMDFQDRVNENMKIFKNKIDPILKCLEQITRTKSVQKLENELKNKNLPHDIESQEYPNADAFRILSREEEVDSITSSFILHLEEMTNKTHTKKDEEILLHYSCLGFCTTSLMRETIEIESEVKELLIWENPSSQPNFKEIYCKINALRSA